MLHSTLSLIRHYTNDTKHPALRWIFCCALLAGFTVPAQAIQLEWIWSGYYWEARYIESGADTSCDGGSYQREYVFVYDPFGVSSWDITDESDCPDYEPLIDCLSLPVHGFTFELFEDLEAYSAFLTLELGTDVLFLPDESGDYLAICEDGDDATDDCFGTEAEPTTVIVWGSDTGVENFYLGDLPDTTVCTLSDLINCALVNSANVAMARDLPQIKGTFTSEMARYLESMVVQGIILQSEQDLIQEAVAQLSGIEIIAVAESDLCP